MPARGMRREREQGVKNVFGDGEVGSREAEARRSDDATEEFGDE